MFIYLREFMSCFVRLYCVTEAEPSSEGLLQGDTSSSCVISFVFDGSVLFGVAVLGGCKIVLVML